MYKAWSQIVKNDRRLLSMMEGSLTIYDQALYHQRQAYFKTKEEGKIKTHSAFDLWDLIKNEPKIRDLHIDIHIKQSVTKQVYSAWKAYIKAVMAYKKNPELFTGRPKMPNYLYKSRKYNIIHVDSSRFRKIDRADNSFNLPCSDYRIKLPSAIPLDTVRQVSIQKYFDKIKINIIYNEEGKVVDNQYNAGFSIGIDLGINNLCAITSNDKAFSYVVNGRPLKSMNQYYNKKLSAIKSELDTKNKGQKTSKRLDRLSRKRDGKIKHYLHCVSRQIVNTCIEQHVERIVIGHNPLWKQGCNIGKRNNQNFTEIPFNTLIEMIRYKAMACGGLKVDVVEESYTSKVDHLVFEAMEHHDHYKGKRVKRGLFRSSTGKLINADINGAVGILRKGNAITDGQILALRDRGDIVSPKVFKLNL